MLESKFILVEDDKYMLESSRLFIDVLFGVQPLIARTTEEARRVLEGLGDYRGNIVTILDGQFPEIGGGGISNQFSGVLDSYSSFLSPRMGEKDFFIANSGDETCNTEMVQKIELMYGGKATLLSTVGKPNAVSEGLKNYKEIITS